MLIASVQQRTKTTYSPSSTGDERNTQNNFGIKKDETRVSFNLLAGTGRGGKQRTTPVYWKCVRLHTEGELHLKD